MFETPILFIAFNRPKTTIHVWEVIRKLKPAYLFISCDGPRGDNPYDQENCKEVRDIVSNIDWICNIKYLMHEDNLGCSLAPRTAFNWFFSHVNEGIILEDDCVPSIDFFVFCQILLEKYRNNTSILTINGSNLGYNFDNGYSYTFSRFMNMTGWATWKRAADEIDYSLSSWFNKKHKLFYMYLILKQSIFDFDINWFKYWVDKFNKTVNSEKITWWDWQWIYFQITNHKLSIVPSKNLVTNIGFDEEATHTTNINDPASLVPIKSLSFPLRHPLNFEIDYIYEENYVKKIWCGYNRLPKVFYLKKYIRLYLNKILRPTFNL